MNAVAAPPSTGRIWPILVVALIVLNMTIVAITVYFATSDRSVAIEPDYYSKALKFDETARERQASAALGWVAKPTIVHAPDGKTLELQVILTRQDGRPLDNAAIQVTAFPNAFANRRQTLALHSTDSSPIYTGEVHSDTAGSWHLRITAVRGPDKFMTETDVSCPSTSR